MIDLHAHTTASDGSLSPRDLVALARSQGLRAVAVTDHDTLDGLPEALEAGRELGVELIPGIELAVTHPRGRFHLLGLLIDPGNAAIQDRLDRLKANRARRNQQMLERLQTLGVRLTLVELQQIARGGQIGRPHMALALVRKGYVRDVREAFERFLGEGGAAYVPKEKISPEEGIALIRSAGGVPVAAHPDTLGLSDEELREELFRLKAAGLGGLECWYSAHTPERTESLLRIARAVGLSPTGGSDFHGAAKPHVRLGQVHDGGPLPYAVLESLRAAGC